MCCSCFVLAQGKSSLSALESTGGTFARLSIPNRPASSNFTMGVVGRWGVPWRSPPSASVIVTIYEAIGWAARICPSDVGLLMRDDSLLPSLTKSLLEAPASTLQGQQAVMRELGTICSSTGAQFGAVVSPYFHQCGLLHSMLLTLKRVDIASLGLRLETLRTIGILGALDPQVALLLLDEDMKSAHLHSRVLYQRLCYFLNATQVIQVIITNHLEQLYTLVNQSSQPYTLTMNVNLIVLYLVTLMPGTHVFWSAYYLPIRSLERKVGFRHLVGHGS